MINLTREPLNQARHHLADPAWKRSSALVLLGAAGMAAMAALALSAAVILGPPSGTHPTVPFAAASVY